MLNVHQIVVVASKFLKDNSPTILTGVAIAGSVTSTVLAVKATPRVIEKLHQVEEKKFEANPEGGPGSSRLTVWETVKTAAPYYIPAFAMTGITISCIVSATSINNRRNAALLGAYTLTETAFREYQEKVTTEIGQNKEDKLRKELVDARMGNHPPTDREIVFDNDLEVLCYDVPSDRYFTSDMETIRKAMNDVNFEVNNNMYATQSMFYELIGMHKTGMSDELGWDFSKPLEIHFQGHINEKTGKPCISIDYRMKGVREISSFG